jgi:acetyltransferase-like isoleucine patch superfamily enzyme
MTDRLALAPDVRLGLNVKLAVFINLYGCAIDDNTKIGAFVEIQKNAKVGKNCKISSHTFICEGVTIGDNCFIGHGVMFINDNLPRAVTKTGELESEQDWANRFRETRVGSSVSIGSNATILGGVRIGDEAVIGAGSVVTKDVPAREVWAGNPAKFLRRVP